MEHLAPPLQLLLELRFRVEMGVSVREGLGQVLNGYGGEEFFEKVRTWFVHITQGQDVSQLTWPTSLQQALLDTVRRGLNGEPVHEQLRALEEQMLAQCREELDRHIQSLPVKAVVPLLMFQFPAYLALLLGPVLQHLITSLAV